MFSMACWKPKMDSIPLEHPEDIKALFENPAYSEKGLMSLGQFRRFLSEYQEENDPANVEEIIKRLDNRITQQKGLHFDDFFSYLFGDLNLVLPCKVYQDMNAPLAHYFIHTRVKIRLFSPRKGQLKSSKSRRNIAAIKEALKSGKVRVIQLDLTYIPNKNSSNNGHEDIEINMILKQYMEAIKESAFVESEYPVIIALEGDFDSKIQSQVAQMAKLKFAESLHCPGEHSQVVLSPENLKKKILLTHTAQSPKESYDKEEHTRKVKSFSKRDSPQDGNVMKPDRVENKEYKSLIAIEDVKLKGSLSETLSTKHDNIGLLRLTQPKLETATRSHKAEIIEFTQRNLLMVYPVDKLSGSSNCNPLTGWCHGAQMVAVNMQGHDKYLGVIQGMFKANGECGYVKKPDILLKANENIVDPTTTKPKSILKVKIYMGDGWHLDFSATKFDIFSPPDFFLKVQILGVPDDMKKDETRLEEDKWRPSWNQVFDFSLTAPELAFLRIEARDFDDDRSHAFGGQTCLPVRELKRGIRTVPLYDKRGVIYKHVRLLVEFKLDLEH